MRDVGYVTRGQHDGKDVVGMRMSWDKRYITLGPQATLVGLAFRLFDPENILKLSYRLNQRRLRRLCGEDFFLEFYDCRVASGDIVNVFSSIPSQDRRQP